jgi:hypothetical protein
MNELKLPELNDKEEIVTFLKDAPVRLAEVITGILASDVSQWKMSAGRIVQGALKGNLFTQFGRELNSYREKGEIKEDFLATDYSRMALYELLKIIDSDDVPDEVKYRAVKSIFISGIKKDANQEDELLSYEFLQTARELGSTEILILKANFDIANGNGKDEIVGIKDIYIREAWHRYIATQMGLGKLTSLVEKYEPNLVRLGLISVSTHSDQSGFRQTGYFRLTDTGYKFCQFMTQFLD